MNYYGENKDFTVFFNYTTVRAGVNKGLKTVIDDYLAASGTRYKGDFFTWGGETTSVTYSGVTYTFKKGRVYSWNGNQWTESHDDAQLSESFNNVMSVLDDEIVSNDSKLEQTMRKLSSVTVFCEELAAKVAFIQKLFAQNITMQQGGLFKSANWNGTFNQDTRKITGHGSQGWAQDYFGNLEVVNLYAKSANLEDCKLGGYLWGNSTPFKPCAAGNIGYKDGVLSLYNGKNIASINRDQKGVYTIYFSTPFNLKVHTWEGNNYIDLYVIGNAHDTFDAGFTNPELISINWVRNYVDGRLTVSGGYARVTYATLYFMDNNSDQLIDPRAAQFFIFGAETD